MIQVIFQSFFQQLHSRTFWNLLVVKPHHLAFLHLMPLQLVQLCVLGRKNVFLPAFLNLLCLCHYFRSEYERTYCAHTSYIHGHIFSCICMIFQNTKSRMNCSFYLLQSPIKYSTSNICSLGVLDFYFCLSYLVFDESNVVSNAELLSDDCDEYGPGSCPSV